MKPSAIYIVVLANLALVFASTVNAASWIVKDERAQAEIVIAEQPARAAEFGASELQMYVERISGCRLEILTVPSDTMPVNVYVGESVAARQAVVTAQELGRDAFRMASGPDWLALVGNKVELAMGLHSAALSQRAAASSPEELWPNLGRLHGPVIELDEGFEALELNTEPEPNGATWTYQKEAWFESGAISVVEDLEAPASASKVLQYRFSEGRAGGGSPARTVNRGSKPYKHRYIGFYVRWSAPWDEHRVLDKILYWGEQDRIAAGQNPGQFFVFRQAGLIRVNLQFAQNYEGQPHRRDAHRMMPQPAAGEKRLAATRVDDGKWHLIEIICNQSTNGKPDGRLRVWVDDILQFDFSNVRFNPERDALFRGLDLDPVWGGIGDRKEQTDYLYFDHLLMAGSNAEQE